MRYSHHKLPVIYTASMEYPGNKPNQSKKRPNDIRKYYKIVTSGNPSMIIMKSSRSWTCAWPPINAPNVHMSQRTKAAFSDIGVELTPGVEANVVGDQPKHPSAKSSMRNGCLFRDEAATGLGFTPPISMI